MEDKYISIGELNRFIKNMFDENMYLRKVFLRGEISNFKNHTRGHLYFTLKDDTSRISAVMFYSSAITLNFKPEDGMNVLVEGRISCYPTAGTYQIYVDKMEVDGLGALYIEFEKLKEKLSKEGLFYPIARVLGIICYVVAFISVIYLIYLTIISYRLESIYNKKLRKILKTYDGIIVNLKEMPNINKTKIINILFIKN